MKVLDLRCQQDHTFEGWFGSEADFQDQLQRRLLQCPLCGDSQVRKVLSAPRINLGVAVPQHHLAPGSGVAQTPDPIELPATPQQVPALQGAWLQWARELVARTHDVGAQFADEARRMHHGEVPERPIRGQASMKETAQLLDEGIAVLPLPAAVTETLQ